MFPEGYEKQKADLLSKIQEGPSEETVQAFSSRYQINLDDARKRLEERYRKEVEDIDFKEIALKLNNQFRVMSPKIMGLENREMDRENTAREAIRKANAVESRIERLKEEVYITVIKKLNETLNLNKIVSSMIELEKQNKWVYEEYLNTQKELRKLKQNTLTNRIKKFFGIKIVDG